MDGVVATDEPLFRAGWQAKARKLLNDRINHRRVQIALALRTRGAKQLQRRRRDRSGGSDGVREGKCRG